ncbi:hypothetical protein DFH27DRAFT_614979 [Peziza echinospora]|nr:hypothetical protein DFH27DRAFT_614979 [Peziza echinospora]
MFRHSASSARASNSSLSSLSSSGSEAGEGAQLHQELRLDQLDSADGLRVDIEHSENTMQAEKFREIESVEKL